VAHEWLGIVFEEGGEARAAEVVFADARSRDPAAARARAHLADRALSRGQLARADSLIAEAFAFTSHDADLWALRARLAALGGDPAGALADSERAIYLDPRAPMLLANHGILLWATGDGAAARDFWRLAARWDERVLRYLGDFENAEGDAPAPPLLPLFTLDSFRPPAELRPGRGPD
jgi:Flp pilus assembly protein TadD